MMFTFSHLSKNKGVKTKSLRIKELSVIEIEGIFSTFFENSTAKELKIRYTVFIVFFSLPINTIKICKC